jgi:hypothetical protein
MRKVIITTIVTGLIGLGGVAVPMAAFADTPPGTSATLGVSGGALTITVPESADLGSVAAGQHTTSGLLGTVTVGDERATDGGEWTATAVTSDFATLSTAGPVETIPATDLTYTPGATTANTGTATLEPGAAAAGMSTAATAYSASAEVGVTSTSWDPTVGFNLPADVVVGTYDGTITHSVA